MEFDGGHFVPQVVHPNLVMVASTFHVSPRNKIKCLIRSWGWVGGGGAWTITSCMYSDTFIGFKNSIYVI